MDRVPVTKLAGVSHRYGAVTALEAVDVVLPAGCMVGLIGPDGVGKSSLLALVSGARQIQAGKVEVLGGDIGDRRFRASVQPRIAYMPQGLGRNLYPTLSVFENVDFFGRLFGQGKREREQRIAELLASTGLSPFRDRPAAKLSGGMKQKLGLCCALIHDPDLLILDEPTTGVDPLSRRQFWELIDSIRARRPGMSVLVATAYMEEAERFDWLVAMDGGKVIGTGTPAELRAQTGQTTLDGAFIRLLPEERRQAHHELVIPPRVGDGGTYAIEADGLSQRFGDFTAVDHVSFKIERGEIFGFLGSNGCGKTTTMKMLTGLLPPTEGVAKLFGKAVDAGDLETRKQVGYMSQSFSLYGELTVRANLDLHARLFHLPDDRRGPRIAELMQCFGLEPYADKAAAELPLGIRQRLSLAVAMVHKPELLILDEPTSGVDPVARDAFWRLLIELSRRDRVTVFISTHFMNEAERCDRMSMMHAGKVLDSDVPARLVEKRGAKTLEEAFIGYLVEAEGGTAAPASQPPAADQADQPPAVPAEHGGGHSAGGFSLQRMFSYLWRETLELQRDPVRATLALGGSLLLMFVIGFGITMDVEDLSYAVLDRDQTTLSQSYTLNLAGSRYFTEHAPIVDYDDLDRRMRNGELSLAIEIPPGFSRDVLRGQNVQIGAWIDGAMPQRAETVQGYVQGMHQHWLLVQASERSGASAAGNASVETRFRYNPDVKSLPAMVPAVIPLLLLMLPAMLAALAVVREKETGSITNLYVTPVTRIEFLLGKQLPYVGLAMVNFLLMSLLAVTIFGVPVKGSFFTLALAALIFSFAATGMGLLASAVTRSQIAAMFFAMIGTLIPATQFAGLIDPVSSLEGSSKFIGEIYPATHMISISRGVFNKSLGLADLTGPLWSMLISVPVILGVAVLLLKKQER